MQRIPFPGFPASLAAVALALTACADSATAPEALGPETVLASMTKIDVCHVDDVGAYKMITIADAAYDKHIAHGDHPPGADVPDRVGYVFGPGCTPEVGYDVFGDVVWSAQGGTVPGHRTVFALRDDEDSGFATHHHPDGTSTMTLNVECVEVIGDEGWFGGTVATATGAYQDRVGDTTLFWVSDNGIAGSPTDDEIGAWSALDCDDAGSWRGSGVVTDGDLTVGG